MREWKSIPNLLLPVAKLEPFITKETKDKHEILREIFKEIPCNLIEVIFDSFDKYHLDKKFNEEYEFAAKIPLNMYNFPKKNSITWKITEYDYSAFSFSLSV